MNTSVFGQDAEVFRPERWLEESANVDRMEQYLLTVSLPTILHISYILEPLSLLCPEICFSLTWLNDQFGKGPRSCLGRHVSLMEISKLIPEFVLRFDVEMADDKYDWTVVDDWFVVQSDFQVRLKQRMS